MTTKHTPLAVDKLVAACVHPGLQKMWLWGFGPKAEISDPFSAWVLNQGQTAQAGWVDVGFNDAGRPCRLYDVWMVQPAPNMERVEAWPMFASFGRGFGSLRAGTAFGHRKVYPLMVHHLKTNHSATLKIAKKVVGYHKQLKAYESAADRVMELRRRQWPQNGLRFERSTALNTYPTATALWYVLQQSMSDVLRYLILGRTTLTAWRTNLDLVLGAARSSTHYMADTASPLSDQGRMHLLTVHAFYGLTEGKFRSDTQEGVRKLTRLFGMNREEVNNAYSHT
eukprot:GHVQ01019142.1.p1 GENE.GHVQ01019142.1~~GHVQ01019142.1.p1  ORF type:complete len:282 (-),score=15.25 GHVQ01019142.1:34-879(-)